MAVLQGIKPVVLSPEVSNTMLYIYTRYLVTVTNLCASVMTVILLADLASHGQVQLYASHGMHSTFTYFSLFRRSATKRDIIIEHRDGSLQRIHERHPFYLPLRYPIIFPKTFVKKKALSWRGNLGGDGRRCATCVSSANCAQRHWTSTAKTNKTGGYLRWTGRRRRIRDQSVHVRENL